MWFSQYLQLYRVLPSKISTIATKIGITKSEKCVKQLLHNFLSIHVHVTRHNILHDSNKFYARWKFDWCQVFNHLLPHGFGSMVWVQVFIKWGKTDRAIPWQQGVGQKTHECLQMMCINLLHQKEFSVLILPLEASFRALCQVQSGKFPKKTIVIRK